MDFSRMETVAFQQRTSAARCRYSEFEWWATAKRKRNKGLFVDEYFDLKRSLNLSLTPLGPGIVRKSL
jgi:hypothetical protein